MKREAEKKEEEKAARLARAEAARREAQAKRAAEEEARRQRAEQRKEQLMREAAARRDRMAAQGREKAAAAAATAAARAQAQAGKAAKAESTRAQRVKALGHAIQQEVAAGTPAGKKGKVAGSAKKASPARPEDNYEMSDHEGSAAESESEEDEERETSRKGKKIPAWARGKSFREAVIRQFRRDGPRLDPDTIFPEMMTCNLEGASPGETHSPFPPLLPCCGAGASPPFLLLFIAAAAIFDRTKRERYTKRKSSANWIPDQLTRRERENYKRAMGYI